MVKLVVRDDEVGGERRGREEEETSKTRCRELFILST